MDDYYANPEDTSAIDPSTLLNIFSHQMNVFQNNILSKISQTNRATAELIRATANPETVRAVVAEELERAQGTASRKGKRPAKPRKKYGLPPELSEDPTLPFLRVRKFLVCPCFFTEISQEIVHEYVRVLLKLEPDAGDDNAMDIGDPEVDIRSAGIGAALLKFKPLSESDYSNWENREPGALKLSTATFRFEFERSITDPFNREALYVAVNGLLAAFQSGRYKLQLRNGQRLNTRLLERKHLTSIVETHVNYLFKMYKEASETTAEVDKRGERLRKSNKTTRKWQVSLLSIALAVYSHTSCSFFKNAWRPLKLTRLSSRTSHYSRQSVPTA